MQSVPESTSTDLANVELTIEEVEHTARRGEPVTCGIPWPRGLLTDPAQLRLHDHTGQQASLQTRILDRWSDGSVRWLLIDFQACTHANKYHLCVASTPEARLVPAPRLSIIQEPDQIQIDTERAQFHLEAGEGGCVLIAAADTAPLKASFALHDAAGRQFVPRISQLELEESGPLRMAVRLLGTLHCENVEPLTDFSLRLHFFAGSPTVRFELTLRNPRQAAHPGGLWDLGNAGSVYLKDAFVRIEVQPAPEAGVLLFSPEHALDFETASPPLEIYQDSSGGPNWHSSNHINRQRVIPNTFCGYRLRVGGTERRGRRAAPVVSLRRGNVALSITMPYFWQNFPKALEASETALLLSLFPSQYADVHELQGGEQKTHEFYVAFGEDRITVEPLAWARSPLHVRATPQWYCDSGAVPYLTPREGDSHAKYLRLVDAAIEGEDTFEHKREIIDEYGWRHFGDIYGDHEAVFHKGPTPLVSHYNNQYDPLAGFAYQYLRSGDVRWYRHMDELAAHVADIDIYHTDRDKSAYNHGLFWHTFHYADADTGTHRSYPRSLRQQGGPVHGKHDYPERSAAALKAAYAAGGGPSASQNYNTGLMFHYFLTGKLKSREAALELAQWVVDMDDGRLTIFRWLDRGYTGHATASGSPLYHGPGRAAANSLNVLVDGYRLTGEARFRKKAEQIVYRCIHPEDDIAARDFANVELRWFYAMFLQALGRFLDDKIERAEMDFIYAYGQASLLHYARWMAEHEYPYLDKPERLQYPTETWAAQDMRKSEVFKYAAMYASGAERQRFLERAEFFFRNTVDTLTEMKTRTLARPVVLMLSYGYMQAYFEAHPDVVAPLPKEIPATFGKPQPFVPQKVRAKKRFLIAAGAAALAVLTGAVYLLSLLLKI